MSRFYPGGLMKGLTHGAVVVSGGGTDPMTLSPVGAWDTNRSTRAANINGTGTATTGAGLGYLADRSGQARHATGDGTTVTPILRNDATLSKLYREYAISVGGRLITPSFTLAQPFTLFTVARPRTWASDKYLCCSRGGYSAIVTQQVSSPNIVFYDGSASVGTQALALLGWHVIVTVFNGSASTMQVDNNAAVTGNPGATGIVGGLVLGAGPDADVSHWGDYDIMSEYLFAGAMSAGNISGVKTYLGADVGLSL